MDVLVGDSVLQFHMADRCIFRVWDGAILHGLIGVIVVMIIFALSCSFFRSLVYCLIPFGLVNERLNSINGGVGRVIELPFAMLFPAPRTKIFCCCRPARSGNPFSTPTVCCRAGFTRLLLEDVVLLSACIRKPRPRLSQTCSDWLRRVASLLSFRQ